MYKSLNFVAKIVNIMQNYVSNLYSLELHEIETRMITRNFLN